MTEEVKKIAPIIWKEIKKAKRILLHLHPSPDGDCTGAALAMMWAMEGLGKKVTIISGDSNPPSTLSSMPGFEKIENKDINQIQLDDYDLFIIQDASAWNQVSRKNLVGIPEKMMTVVIDHHGSNAKFGKINLVEPTYPATCQLVYDLLTCWKIKITPEIADCLYVGIYTDTGGFKYFPTSANTLMAAAKLASVSTDFVKLIFNIENSNSEGKIRFIGLALSQVELFYGKQVAISAISSECLRERSIDNSDTEKTDIANILKSVVGWNIGILMMEVENGSVNVSLRTRDSVKFDVSKLAKTVGGGGHPASSGATIPMAIEEAKKYLLEKVGEVYPELLSTDKLPVES